MATSKAAAGVQSQIMQGTSALEHHQHQVQKQNFFSRPMSGNSNSGSNGGSQQKQGKAQTSSGNSVQTKQPSSSNLGTTGVKGQSGASQKVYM